MKQLCALSVIIILVLTMPSCKWLREKGIIGRKARAKAELLARQKSIRIADSLKQVQERLAAIEQARLDSLQNAERERQEMESRFKYNIIVGSFITPEYARNYAAEFTSRGYNVRILKLEGTSFEMVSAEGHERFSTAVSRLRQFQDTVAYDAWLYVYKKPN